MSAGRDSPFCLKVTQHKAIGANLGYYLAQASSFDLHGTVQVGACSCASQFFVSLLVCFNCKIDS